MKNSNGGSTNGKPPGPNLATEAGLRAHEAVLKSAVKEAIRRHHLLGNPVAIWDEGRVVLLYPDGTKRPPEPIDARELERTANGFEE